MSNIVITSYSIHYTKLYDYASNNGVSYNGFVAGENSSVLSGTPAYSGDSQTAVDAGDYTITPSGLSSNNYNISFVDGTLTINKAPLSITANNDSKDYDGLAYSGDNVITSYSIHYTKLYDK